MKAINSSFWSLRTSASIWFGACLCLTAFANTAQQPSPHPEAPKKYTFAPGYGFVAVPSSPSDPRNPPDRPPECPPCPPCFNCNVPGNECLNFGECHVNSGMCSCPEGFGSENCGVPLCGGLPDGDNRPLRDEGSTECDCKDGWTGINCNNCVTDAACDPLIPGDLPGKCYHSLTPIVKHYQMCNVTNQKIIDTLGPDNDPQVTFQCSRAQTQKEKNSCAFQFWIGGLESFFCELDECVFQPGVDGPVAYAGDLMKEYTRLTEVMTGDKPKQDDGPTPDQTMAYHVCQKVKCGCIKDRMLCGKDGFIDITDFLENRVKGPGTYSCNPERGCRFKEPQMDGLIKWAFGDDFISLKCNAGECVHESQIPHRLKPPPPKIGPSILVSMFVAFLLMLILGVAMVYCISAWNTSAAIHFMHKRLHKGGWGTSEETQPLTSADLLRADPVNLLFKDVEYSIRDSRLLEKLTGTARAGRVMAVMGASGAGKSTLLEILAGRSKSGKVRGDIWINEKPMDRQKYLKMVGFVDQEDTLLGTLTVEETILYSALLRLPRNMVEEEKLARVRETMVELGILDIAHQRIGLSNSNDNSRKRRRQAKNQTIWQRMFGTVSSPKPTGVSTRGGISGGEKRRVSIACELVSSPSVLFLDEPTSGLDAYNAYQVVSSLVTLAKEYKRTIVMTLHQPSSNLFSLIDDLTLLSPEGQMVYHGPTKEAMHYFFSDPTASMALSSTIRDIGNINLPDLLIDLTMQKQERKRQERLARMRVEDKVQTQPPAPVDNSGWPSLAPSRKGKEAAFKGNNGNGNNRNPLDRVPAAAVLEFNPWGPVENGAKHRNSNASRNRRRQPEQEAPADAPSSPASGDSFRRWPASDPESEDDDEPDEYLIQLVEHYKQSKYAQQVQHEIDQVMLSYVEDAGPIDDNENQDNKKLGINSRWKFWKKGKTGPTAAPDEDEEVESERADGPLLPKGAHLPNHKPETEAQDKAPVREESATWMTQLRILSDRTLKNLYRNPMLLATHYLSSIFIGLLCGLLFWQVTNDIAGFQNRLGCFFFVCALFGFGCLTSIYTFQADRVLFVRERANHYYEPITYFLSKALFDLIPLRVIPPLLLGVIIYPMVGLVMDPFKFFKFLLVLVLFNVTSASIVLVIGIVASNASVANLVASLVMLFSMLFGGLLLNRETIPYYLSWLQDLSFFNYALEGLIVNELKDLQLKEHKYGLEIEVPAAVILSTFGFDAQAFWPDFIKLVSLFVGSLVVGFVWLQLFVKERR